MVNLLYVHEVIKTDRKKIFFVYLNFCFWNFKWQLSVFRHFRIFGGRKRTYADRRPSDATCVFICIEKFIGISSEKIVKDSSVVVVVYHVAIVAETWVVEMLTFGWKAPRSTQYREVLLFTLENVKHTVCPRSSYTHFIK